MKLGPGLIHEPLMLEQENIKKQTVRQTEVLLYIKIFRIEVACSAMLTIRPGSSFIAAWGP